jgi:membrane fusion protein, multidrug efflux system
MLIRLAAWRRALVILAGLVFTCIVASSCRSTGSRPSGHPSVPVVETVRAARKTLPLYRQYLGQTAAINPVEIRPQVTGLLREIAFREGSIVKKGQLLFTIDPRPYKAALNAAKANLAQGIAALADDRADLTRDRILFRTDVLPRQQLDTQVARTQEAEANVEAAQAAVDTAALNLGYTQIHAPIEGRIGMAQVKVGGLVQQNTTLLDTIYSINPIYVDFSVTEASYLNYELAASKGDADSPLLELILPNDSTYGQKGKIVMANPTVDPTTGTLELRAEFPNPEGILLPGLFVQVKARVGEKTNAVVVPEQAVQRVQGQASVYVVGAGNKVEFRNVELGPAVDHMQVIDSGVQAGEQVIVAGQQMVRPGMTVSPELRNGATHQPQFATESLAAVRAAAKP